VLKGRPKSKAKVVDPNASDEEMKPASDPKNIGMGVNGDVER